MSDAAEESAPEDAADMAIVESEGNFAEQMTLADKKRELFSEFRQASVELIDRLVFSTDVTTDDGRVIAGTGTLRQYETFTADRVVHTIELLLKAMNVLAEDQTLDHQWAELTEAPDAPTRDGAPD